MTDDRVVLRSGWLVDALTFLPLPVANLAYSLRSVGVLLPDRSVRPLPAPRSLLGVGGRDVAHARDLIEQHSDRHRAKLTAAPPSA